MRRNSLRAAIVLVLGAMLFGCGAMLTRSGGREAMSMISFHGPPEVRLFIPRLLHRVDLVEGLPLMSVEGPEDLAYRFAIVDDSDRNFRPSAGEERVEVPLQRSDGRWIIVDARLTADQQARFKSPIVVFDFDLNGEQQLYVQAIE